MTADRGMSRPVLMLAGLLAGCTSVTPLTNKIQVGQEPFVIGVGEGSDGQTDLYAAPAHGGGFVRLTFTRAEERLPRLDPGGTRLAFVRRPAADQPWSLVVLDLLTNRENTTPVPRAAGDPVALGWSREGGELVLRSYGPLVSPAPPRSLWLRPVQRDSVEWADSVVTVLLGERPSARLATCPGDTVCVVAERDTTRLPGATRPLRWGPDSIGYLIEGEWEIRPLRGGRARRPNWNAAPGNLRDLTYGGGERPPGGVSSPP